MENHDVRRVVKTEAGGPGEPPIKAITEEVEPNIYEIQIKPEDWKQNLSIFECELEVIGMHESCICHAYPDDDMMMNKSTDRKAAQKLLEDVYDGKLIIKTATYKIKCQFIGPCPTETIYMTLEELPFFDVPASKLGL